jgi:hypothetical protein
VASISGRGTAAFNLFFVRFDVSGPTEDLGIRVRELKESTREGKKGIDETPDPGNAWLIGIKGPAQRRAGLPGSVGIALGVGAWPCAQSPLIGGAALFPGRANADHSIIYVDSPFTSVISRFVPKGKEGNIEDLVPFDSRVSIIQFVEVINKKTNQRLASKLVALNLNIINGWFASTVDTVFLPEDHPAYRALERAFLKQRGGV